MLYNLTFAVVEFKEFNVIFKIVIAVDVFNIFRVWMGSNRLQFVFLQPVSNSNNKNVNTL